MIQPKKIGGQELQNLIDAGLAKPELIEKCDREALLTRAWWIYFSPVDEWENNHTLELWEQYCMSHFPGVDPNEIDIALGAAPRCYHGF